MAITTIDIERKRNDTKRMVFTIKDSTGAAVDISTWTNFIMTVDPEKAPASAANNEWQANGVFVTDGTDGKVYFVPPGTSNPGTYFYDIQALNGAGEKCTFVEGKYKLTQDITKD